MFSGGTVCRCQAEKTSTACEFFFFRFLRLQWGISLSTNTKQHPPWSGVDWKLTSVRQTPEEAIAGTIITEKTGTNIMILTFRPERFLPGTNIMRHLSLIRWGSSQRPPNPSPHCCAPSMAISGYDPDLAYIESASSSSLPLSTFQTIWVQRNDTRGSLHRFPQTGQGFLC